jgi:hypothetical protein
MMGIWHLRHSQVTMPSPLAGEGCTFVHHKDDGVRGSHTIGRATLPPLTRPRCARAPSPTRGEGRMAPFVFLQHRAFA